MAACLSGISGCAGVTARPGTVAHVGHGGSFALALGQSHQLRLAVQSPSDRWMVLVENGIENTLMSEEAFMATSSLRIDTLSLVGIVLDDEARPHVVTVFSEPGTYSFHVSDNLDTEFENLQGVTIRVAYE